MSPLLDKIKSWWESTDKTQRFVTIGGSVFLLFLLVGTYYFATRPKFALLYSGMNEADKSQVVTELQAMGVPVKYDVPGQIEIPEDKVGEVNMKLAGSGKLPKSAHPGIPDLDKMSLFSTPAQEKERLKVILEGELAKSIETLDSVQAARVHLTLGDNSPFVQEKKPPTASVSVTEENGSSLTPDQGRAIATLVANACEGMDIRNVSVLNQRMQFIFNGQELGDDKSVAADKLDMEARIAKERQREIQSALDSVFGPGSTVVMVRCELDLDRQKLHAINQTPSEEPIRSEKTTEEMTGTGGPQGGVAGTGTNTPAAPATPPNQTGDQKYINKTAVENRLTNEVTTDTEKATGAIKSMTINVIANTDKITDLNSLQQIVNGEVKNRGNDPTNFPLPTVTGVKFDTSAADAANKAQADAAQQARMQQMMSLVPIAALLIVAAVVIRQIGKFAKPAELVRMEEHLPVPFGALEAENATGEYGEGDEEETDDLLEGLGDGDNPMLPSADAADYDPDNIMDALRMSEKRAKLANPDVIVAEIQDRIDPPLEALKKMADEKPEMVAMLIKSMLLEERK